MKRLTVVAAVAAVVVAALPGTASGAAPSGEIRPGGSTAIAGSFLVVLRPGAPAGRVADLATGLGGRIGQRFSTAVPGFELSTSDPVAKRLAGHPDVAYVERNALHTVDRAVPRPIAPDGRAAPDGVQPNPPSWGLDRVDQHLLPLDLVYNYPNNGAGVRAYVFGTGIRFTHTDFGGRAVSGFDVIDGGAADDCNGLSTHLAGTVGGAAYGIAKGATLVAIRNVNCQGSATTAQVVASIDWLTANVVHPAVALMTLGSAGSTTFDNAIRGSIASGVPYVVSAGSSNSNACNFSPGRVAEAITVSATDQTDPRASFANFGPCLDLFAPGVGIASDWWTSNTATSVISGTSVSAAHVAGAAALLLFDHPTWTPAQLQAGLTANATPGVVLNAGLGSPNRLVFVGPAACSGTNGTDVVIPDWPAAAVVSDIMITGCGGPAGPSSTVEVHIIHPFRGDLVIDLVAPDGTSYRLQSLSADSGDDIHTTYVVDLSTETRDGRWRLRVRDRRAANTGRIDSWTVRL